MLMALLGWAFGAGVRKFIIKKPVSWQLAALISFPFFVGFIAAGQPVAAGVATPLMFMALNHGYVAPKDAKKLIPRLIDNLRGVYGWFLILIARFRRIIENKRKTRFGATEADEQLYLQVGQELESGSRKEGLWY